METPSSTRRVTRLQTSVAANKSNTNSIPMSTKIEDPENNVPKSKQRNQQDRSALIDISNDSPIVGLAMGRLKTPSSKNKDNTKTPGSGEALLRSQVKSLLQKVEEEEAELFKISLDQEQIEISQMGTHISDGKKQDGPDAEKSLITRSLLLDFYEKSESLDFLEGGIGGEGEIKHKSSMEGDDSLTWSIQANASTREQEKEEEYDDDDDDGELVDTLCDGMRKISVNGTEKAMPEIQW